MKRVCKRKIQIDALTMCYEVESTYYYDRLCQLDYDDTIDLGDFQLTRTTDDNFSLSKCYLKRTTGRYYYNVYDIKAWNGMRDIIFGQLKFNLANGNDESNVHSNGLTKVWVSLNNETLYSTDIYFLDYITDRLGLIAHNITTLDLCLDTSFNVSSSLKQFIRDKSITTILNGRRIIDREADRPEIVYVMSGNLNKYKYLTLSIKQRNAIKDKSKGVTIITYDKKAEILNSSEKDYILDYYQRPRSLYRTEVHLNNEDIKAYLNRKGKEFNPLMIFDEAILEDMFFHHLNSVIRFQSKTKDVSWSHILGRS